MKVAYGFLVGVLSLLVRSVNGGDVNVVICEGTGTASGQIVATLSGSLTLPDTFLIDDENAPIINNVQVGGTPAFEWGFSDTDTGIRAYQAEGTTSIGMHTADGNQVGASGAWTGTGDLIQVFFVDATNFEVFYDYDYDPINDLSGTLAA